MPVNIIFIKATAEQLLAAAELQCLDGTMKCVIEVTNTDFIYTIPNYCIIDPVFIKDFNIVGKHSNITDKELNVIIFFLIFRLFYAMFFNKKKLILKLIIKLMG